MRRGLLHLLAWLLATGAAVTLSWWGVHTVLAGTAYDPPRALPITAADATAPAAPVLDTPTKSPKPSPGTRRPEKNRTSTPTPRPTAAESATARPSPTPSGRIKSYDTDGGRVVFSLGEAYATLVSATPGSGWSMQVWKTETWIRVDFASGADRVSVFCTWHDSAPRVDVQDF
ncbi:hypothetical protein [Streptomyces graminofaciens]|nr:hypothetical protein [Streptomyces graminofaciens]